MLQLLLLLLLIIMNMQNKLYTISFFYYPMTDSQPIPKQWLLNPETHEFREIPKEDWTPGKVWTPRQERIQTHGSEKEEIPNTRPTVIPKLSVISMVWNTSSGQLGLAAWLCSLPAPAHMFASWIWEIGKKVLDLIATTKNVNIVNISLILNRKNNSYCEEN